MQNDFLVQIVTSTEYKSCYITITATNILQTIWQETMTYTLQRTDSRSLKDQFWIQIYQINRQSLLKVDWLRKQLV